YQDSIRKTKRADGKAAVVELANFMERFFTENNTYVGAAVPADITSDNYTITISAQSANAYTLQAAPAGPQTADSCGTMTMTSTNVGAPANCW
ncbi:MAG: hypothetical protein DRQ35_07285, partial [Gammaproteobacteria bacterium]